MTLRGSYDHFIDQKAAHLVSAFDVESALVLGHIEVDDKSNEIPAVERLIGELGLAGGRLPSRLRMSSGHGLPLGFCAGLALVALVVYVDGQDQWDTTGLPVSAVELRGSGGRATPSV